MKVVGTLQKRCYRNKKEITPRDNILFEMGLCIGKFGLKNVIVAKPQEIVLPTDMDRISVYNYLMDEDLNITAGCICSEVITSFEEKKKEVKAID